MFVYIEWYFSKQFLPWGAGKMFLVWFGFFCYVPTKLPWSDWVQSEVDAQQIFVLCVCACIISAGFVLPSNNQKQSWRLWPAFNFCPLYCLWFSWRDIFHGTKCKSLRKLLVLLLMYMKFVSIWRSCNQVFVLFLSLFFGMLTFWMM